MESTDEVTADVVRAMADRQEIIALAIAYCWSIDGHRWDDLDDIFTIDATADFATAGVHDGRAGIKERIEGALGSLDASQHIVSNHQISLEGDTARHRCQMQAQHVRHDADGGPNYMVAGRYEDRLVRTAEGWRIAHRDLVIAWTDGNIRVVRP